MRIRRWRIKTKERNDSHDTRVGRRRRLHKHKALTTSVLAPNSGVHGMSCTDANISPLPSPGTSNMRGYHLGACPLNAPGRLGELGPKISSSAASITFMDGGSCKSATYMYKQNTHVKVKEKRRVFKQINAQVRKVLKALGVQEKLSRKRGTSRSLPFIAICILSRIPHLGRGLGWDLIARTRRTRA